MDQDRDRDQDRNRNLNQDLNLIHSSKPNQQTKSAIKNPLSKTNNTNNHGTPIQK